MTNLIDNATVLAELLDGSIEPGDSWAKVVDIAEAAVSEIGYNLNYAAYAISWAIATARVDGFTAAQLERMDAIERVYLIDSLAGVVMADVPRQLFDYVAGQ